MAELLTDQLRTMARLHGREVAYRNLDAGTEITFARSEPAGPDPDPAPHRRRRVTWPPSPLGGTTYSTPTATRSRSRSTAPTWPTSCTPRAQPAHPRAWSSGTGTCRSCPTGSRRGPGP